MNRIVKTCIASVVSEIRQSDIYLTVKARLFETPGANLNGVRVTAAFLDEIVANEDKYVGLPLCADVRSLANGEYDHLGHLYDARTGEFHSAQIGSFYSFEKEKTADGAALIGYARVMKRNKAVCHALSELFADGALKFSFEISCGSYRELDDGTIEIDASADNFLEGAAVVSFPACESAVALDLVAECNRLANDGEEGEAAMTDVNESSVIAEEANAEESEQIAPVTEVAEAAAVEEPTVETAETEDTQRTDETAEVIVKDHHYEHHETQTIDTETGRQTEESVTYETHSVTPVSTLEDTVCPECVVDNSVQVVEFAQDGDVAPDAVQSTVEELSASCGNDKEPEKETAEEESEECIAEQKEETAGQRDELAQVIASLQSEIAKMREEIAELRSKSEQSEEPQVPINLVAEANPFIGEITPQEDKVKYSLLEPDDTISSYTLLDRA